MAHVRCFHTFKLHFIRSITQISTDKRVENTSSTFRTSACLQPLHASVKRNPPVSKSKTVRHTITTDPIPALVYPTTQLSVFDQLPLFSDGKRSNLTDTKKTSEFYANKDSNKWRNNCEGVRNEQDIYFMLCQYEELRRSLDQIIQWNKTSLTDKTMPDSARLKSTSLTSSKNFCNSVDKDNDFKLDCIGLFPQKVVISDFSKLSDFGRLHKTVFKNEENDLGIVNVINKEPCGFDTPVHPYQSEVCSVKEHANSCLTSDVSDTVTDLSEWTLYYCFQDDKRGNSRSDKEDPVDRRLFPKGKPSLEQLEETKVFLNDMLEGIATGKGHINRKDLYRMHYKDMLLSINRSGKNTLRIRGIETYMNLFTCYQFWLDLLYSAYEMDVQSLLIQPEQGCVKIHWRLLCNSKFNLPFSRRMGKGCHEGISTFYIGGDGRIFHHYLTKTLDEESRAPVVKTVKKKIVEALGQVRTPVAKGSDI